MESKYNKEEHQLSQIATYNKNILHLKYSLRVLKSKIVEMEENIIKLEKNSKKYTNS